MGGRTPPGGVGGVRGSRDRCLHGARPELQGFDHAPPGDRSLRDGARIRADRGQHLPRGAVGRAALPHASGARVRRLSDSDRRPVSGKLGHSRRRRCVRHPRASRGSGAPEGSEARSMAKAALTESHPGTSLSAMLEARSVAVVGASPRNGSFGEQMMLQLTRGGFDGAIHPVNPRYDDVMGYRCLPSIADVPGPVDLAILGVSNAMLEEQMRAAAKAGARSAVIFASCYERPSPGRPTLAVRLTTIAGEADMSLCGGNGMGFINVDRRLRACGFSEPDDLAPGGTTLITHSGSVFSALLHNRRGLRFNLAVSSGLELVTTVGDYMDHALS